MRPHGEHPTMGVCDCDECQAYDEQERKMERMYKAVRWESSRGWAELRFHEPDSQGTGPYVTGHWRGRHGEDHDTDCIVDREGLVSEKEIRGFCFYATATHTDMDDFREEILLVIGKEYDTTAFGV